MRRRAAVVAALVLAPALGACSGDPQEAYCEKVEDHQAALTEVAASDDTGSLLDALPIYRDLADAAPRDVAADWDQVVDGLAGLAEALDEAGVDPSSYDAEQPPAGLADRDREAIEAAARELGSEATVDAMASVEQHALDVCGTPLSR
jgi:hypothetical protein